MEWPRRTVDRVAAEPRGSAARRSLWRVLPSLLVVGLVACGGSGGSSTAAAPAAILRVGTVNYIDTLNPFTTLITLQLSIEYPQLVQLGPGFRLEGDWASSWTHSSNGLIWTFHLRPGGKWSDGVPLTAADAAWTGNTILRYQSGATAAYASAMVGVRSFSDPNPDTLVVRYSTPIGNVLANMASWYVLPEHVWKHHLGTDGKGLTSYDPAQHLPTVAAAFSITQYNQKGTTVFRANPHYYGPKPHVKAIALTYYTNPTAVIADLEAGNIDMTDEVPWSAAHSVAADHSLRTQSQLGGAYTSAIAFDSNPLKAGNRELLNPRVKEALEYATPRRQIINVVYDGFGVPWANMIAVTTGDRWVNPAVRPLPYDPAKANQILNSLGYRMGPSGLRMVPATHGKLGQPAHAMRYGMIVGDSSDFNGSRMYSVIAAAWRKIGVQLTEVPGGDANVTTQLEEAGGYTKFDMALTEWSWPPDPGFLLSVPTRSAWDNWSDTGYNNPTYNRLYTQQSITVSQAARRALVWRMEAMLAQQRPYIQLVNEDLIIAYNRRWTGFHPGLEGLCKCFFTDPHTT